MRHLLRLSLILLLTLTLASCELVGALLEFTFWVVVIVLVVVVAVVWWIFSELF